MIRSFARYSLYFVFLILLQVLILNNINFSEHVNPYLYVVFIMALPFELSPIWILLLGLVTGLTIDLLSFTPGIHASATV